MQGNITTIRNIGDKTLSRRDFSAFINGVGNDLKIAIDDVIDSINYIHEDVQKLKKGTLKPDADIAESLLEYISWEESKHKEVLEKLFNKEIEAHFEWVDKYCEEHSLKREEVLIKIIEGEI